MLASKFVLVFISIRGMAAKRRRRGAAERGVDGVDGVDVHESSAGSADYSSSRELLELAGLRDLVQYTLRL